MENALKNKPESVCKVMEHPNELVLIKIMLRCLNLEYKEVLSETPHIGLILGVMQ